MSRIEEFELDGKSFVYFDLSGFRKDNEYIDFIATAKTVIKKYPPNSLYTITNMKGAMVGGNTHVIMSEWVTHNKPYVKFGAVCSADTTAKVIGHTVSVVSQRSNLMYVDSKEEAIDSLLALE